MSRTGFVNMQNSYSEGVGSNYNQKPPYYANNIRYQLAKQKVDDLFLKWLSHPNSQKLIQQLITDIKSGKQQNLVSQPSPFFTNKMAMSMAMNQSAILSSPGSKSRISPTTPPRNELLQETKLGKSISDELSSNLSQSIVKSSRQFEPQVEQVRSLVSQMIQTEIVPQFYFPEGKTLDSVTNNEQVRIISDVFKSAKNEELDLQQFNQVTINICGLPKSLNQILFQRIDTINNGKISKSSFLKYWNKSLINIDPQHRCFMILKKLHLDYITADDFKPYFKVLLDEHPGLLFLKETPDFQERYADTVIMRIFYKVNRKDNGKITWREFKQSDLFQIMEIVDKEEDINKIRQYFSYEHFYVMYCKFWELDNDHDFLISKEDFQRYSGHGLSRKVVDRIFEQIPRKFKSKQLGKMSYEDFTYFILCEEDKTTIQSVEYWFKIIDLDDNGIITGSEMEYFFDEQRQRMDYLNHEPVLFQDLVCQMADLLHPEKEIQYSLKNFKDNLLVCGVFFNFLTNLNKLVAYEQRDPFQVRHELNEHPGYSDWDRFAQQEYMRLAMEDENQDNGEVFEGDNPWDNENDEAKNT